MILVVRYDNGMIIVVFHENNKYYTQFSLDECQYKI